MDRGTFDNDVRLAIYRQFVERGHAPVAAEVGLEVGAGPADVELAFKRLHDAHVIVLAPGSNYLWMVNPFSALPTAYAVDVRGKSFWGNCIWDALGIVALLGGTGTVHTRCPDCADELTVEIQDNEPVHRDGVVHYAVPAAHWWDDIGFN